MTPMDRVEALYESLVTHYGDGDEPEVRAAAKLLLVALERLQLHAGPGWASLVREYLDIASNDPERFAQIMARNRSEGGRILF